MNTELNLKMFLKRILVHFSKEESSKIIATGFHLSYFGPSKTAAGFHLNSADCGEDAKGENNFVIGNVLVRKT